MSNAEVDHLVDRANLRIEQYRRHIESMEREGRQCEGATLVLARLQRFRDTLQSNGDMVEFMHTEFMHTDWAKKDDALLAVE